MYRYRLEKIKFNEGTEIEPGSLTVIVGPNNSRKSRVLELPPVGGENDSL